MWGFSGYSSRIRWYRSSRLGGNAPKNVPEMGGIQRLFSSEVLEVSAGEVAGIKSATIRLQGEHAFGWARTETGVHRLVKKIAI